MNVVFEKFLNVTFHSGQEPCVDVDERSTGVLLCVSSVAVMISADSECDFQPVNYLSI